VKLKHARLQALGAPVLKIGLDRFQVALVVAHQKLPMATVDGSRPWDSATGDAGFASDESTNILSSCRSR
jgi:hypothetical protein